MFKTKLLIIGITVLISACNEADKTQYSINDISKTVIKQPIENEKKCNSTSDYMVKAMYGRPLIRKTKKLLSKELYESYKNKYQNITGDFNRNRVNAADTCDFLNDLYKNIDGKLRDVDVSNFDEIAKVECNTRSQFMEISQRTKQIIRSTTSTLSVNEFDILMAEYKGIIEAYKNDPLHQNDALQQDDLAHQNKACRLMLELSNKADELMLTTRN